MSSYMQKVTSWPFMFLETHMQYSKGKDETSGEVYLKITYSAKANILS